MIKKNNNGIIKNRGVTLMELIVAVAIFSIFIVAISGLFISGVNSQRRVLANQELLDQTSYVLEYMSRSLRMAQKELYDDPFASGFCKDDPANCRCLKVTGYGYNYEIEDDDKTIKFTNYNDICESFSLEFDQIWEERGSEKLAITSDKFNVKTLFFDINGESQADFFQPRVTILLEIEGRAVAGWRPKVKIQTSISQRSLDVFNE